MGYVMATESTLWDWLKKARDHFGAELHIRRVENLCETGGPDVEFCHRGSYADVELKVCERPRSDDTRLRYHEVTEQQVDWHSKRQAAGGATGFLIQIGHGHDAERFLVHGSRAGQLRTGVSYGWLKIKGYPVARDDAVITEAVRLTKEK